MSKARVEELNKLLAKSDIDPKEALEYAYRKLVVLKMLGNAEEIAEANKLVDDASVMCTDAEKETWKNEEINALQDVKRENAFKGLLVEDYSRFWSLLTAQTVGYSESAIRDAHFTDHQQKAAEGELAAAAAAAAAVKAETTETGFLPDYPRRLLY